MKPTSNLTLHLWRILWKWILISSSDPAEVSDSIKGFLIALAASLVPVFALVHVPVDSTLITTIIVSVVGVIQASLILVGAIIVFIGVLNKIVRTFNGTNKSLNAIPPLVSPSDPTFTAQDPLDMAQ